MSRSCGVLVLAFAAAVSLSACGRAPGNRVTNRSADPTPSAIGVESQYADVLAQIAGPNLVVAAIETNPNTDPHEFEASPLIARRIQAASLVIENGLGYDPWVERILAASAGERTVIDVQRLLGLPATANPHVWYAPGTMPAVATAVAAALSVRQPAKAAYFHERARAFTASLMPLREAIQAFRRHYGGITVAVTEPVANDLLVAAGCTILTPYALQLAVMNGTDPAPQDVAAQEALLTQHRVAVLVYNRQVTDALTASFVDLARREHVPVVGVYETLPQGEHYQQWMLSTLAALDEAASQDSLKAASGARPVHP